MKKIHLKLKKVTCLIGFEEKFVEGKVAGIVAKKK
jgi:hypothetical protein